MGNRKYATFKKDYAELFDKPASFFRNCSLYLTKRFFANPRLEIWGKGGQRRYWIEASEGPAGLMLRIQTPINNQIVATNVSEREVELMIYCDDEWTRKFRLWYDGKGEHPGEKPE